MSKNREEWLKEANSWFDDGDLIEEKKVVKEEDDEAKEKKTTKHAKDADNDKGKDKLDENEMCEDCEEDPCVCDEYGDDEDEIGEVLAKTGAAKDKQKRDRLASQRKDPQAHRIALKKAKLFRKTNKAGKRSC